MITARLRKKNEYKIFSNDLSQVQSSIILLSFFLFIKYTDSNVTCYNYLLNLRFSCFGEFIMFNFNIWGNQFTGYHINHESSVILLACFVLNTFVLTIICGRYLYPPKNNARLYLSGPNEAILQTCCESLK